jgi:hypothetical protein
MRSRLPQFPRRWPRWQKDALAAGRAVGAFIIQFAAGIALGFAGLAVADTVTTSPGLHYLVALGFVIVAALTAWSAWVAHHRAGRGRRRNHSIHSQTHNLSIRALIRGFRRG